MPEPLFDTAFQEQCRARIAKIGQAPCRFYTEAEARLQERLADLKKPPPDLKLSCLELQQTNDLPGRLKQIFDSLMPGGLFLGVMVGGETLCELRRALMEAELTLKGGASLRVAPMAALSTLSRLLAETGFSAPVADTERLTLVYPDLLSLLHALRSMGWTNSLTARSRRFAPRQLFNKTARLYAERFPGPQGRGLAVTVDLLFLHGWKPY